MAALEGEQNDLLELQKHVADEAKEQAIKIEEQENKKLETKRVAGEKKAQKIAIDEARKSGEEAANKKHKGDLKNLKDLRAEKNDLKQDYEELKEDKETLEQDLADLKKKSKSNARKLKDSEIEMALLRSELDEVNQKRIAQLKEHSGRVDQLRTELEASILKSNGDAEIKLSNARDEIAALKLALEEQKRHAPTDQEMLRGQRNSERKMRELSSKLVNLEAELAIIDSDNQGMKLEIRQKSDLIQRMTMQELDSKRKIGELKAELRGSGQTGSRIRSRGMPEPTEYEESPRRKYRDEAHTAKKQKDRSHQQHYTQDNYDNPYETVYPPQYTYESASQPSPRGSLHFGTGVRGRQYAASENPARYDRLEGQ